MFLSASHPERVWANAGLCDGKLGVDLLLPVHLVTPIRQLRANRPLQSNSSGRWPENAHSLHRPANVGFAAQLQHDHAGKLGVGRRCRENGLFFGFNLCVGPKRPPQRHTADAKRQQRNPVSLVHSVPLSPQHFSTTVIGGQAA